MKKTVTDQSKNKPDSLYLFKNAVKPDGCVDMRSAYGRSIRAVKEALKGSNTEATRAILEDHVSICVTLSKAIERQMLANPGTIFTDDGLNPLISRDLLNLFRTVKTSLSTLMDLKKKKSKKNTGKDPGLAEIFLDI